MHKLNMIVLVHCMTVKETIPNWTEIYNIQRQQSTDQRSQQPQSNRTIQIERLTLRSQGFKLEHVKSSENISDHSSNPMTVPAVKQQAILTS